MRLSCSAIVTTKVSVVWVTYVNRVYLSGTYLRSVCGRIGQLSGGRGFRQAGPVIGNIAIHRSSNGSAPGSGETLHKCSEIVNV
jgi:hypothetical protein